MRLDCAVSALRLRYALGGTARAAALRLVRRACAAAGALPELRRPADARLASRARGAIRARGGRASRQLRQRPALPERRRKNPLRRRTRKTIPTRRAAHRHAQTAIALRRPRSVGNRLDRRRRGGALRGLRRARARLRDALGVYVARRRRAARRCAEPPPRLRLAGRAAPRLGQLLDARAARTARARASALRPDDKDNGLPRRRGRNRGQARRFRHGLLAVRRGRRALGAHKTLCGAFPRYSPPISTYRGLEKPSPLYYYI